MNEFDGIDLRLDLHSEKFAKIREDYPKEWATINSMYQTEIYSMRREAIEIMSSLVTEIGEKEKEILVLKENKKGFFGRFVKGGGNLIFSLVFLFVVVFVSLVITRFSGKEFYNDIINGFKSITTSIVDVSKAINTNVKENSNGNSK